MNTEKLREFARTPEFLARMEEIFFEAMNPDYAEYPKAAGLPRIDFTEGPWTMEGGSIVTPLGPRGLGMLMIAYEDAPVWMLQCLGQYDKEAMPCLKAALRAAYSEKQFFGGRGPEKFTHDGLVYENQIDRSYRSDFQTSNFFKGFEQIRNGTKSLGWNSYQGMLML